jgi:hypothetical protein
MKYQITRRLRERLAESVEPANPNYRVTAATIAESAFQAIKVQLLALGLIELRTELLAGDDRETRVVQLTPRGARHLVKVMAIPKRRASNRCMDPEGRGGQESAASSTKKAPGSVTILRDSAECMNGELRYVAAGGAKRCIGIDAE